MSILQKSFKRRDSIIIIKHQKISGFKKIK